MKPVEKSEKRAYFKLFLSIETEKGAIRKTQKGNV